MEFTSIKKFSTQEIEAAIAQALASLTGWDNCKVEIESIDFNTESGKFTSETVKTKLTIQFSDNTSEIPF